MIKAVSFAGICHLTVFINHERVQFQHAFCFGIQEIKTIIVSAFLSSSGVTFDEKSSAKMFHGISFSHSLITPDFIDEDQLIFKKLFREMTHLLPERFYLFQPMTAWAGSAFTGSWISFLRLVKSRKVSEKNSDQLPSS